MRAIAKLLKLSSSEVDKLAGESSDENFSELLAQLNKLPDTYYETVKARLLAGGVAAALDFVHKTLKELDNEKKPKVERSSRGGDNSGGR